MEKELLIYESPQIEVVEIEAEQCFAQSLEPSNVNPW